ncbi:hypothetical protein F0241_01225 [Vibrio kanaloae]|nr:hypothetical protein F7Q89_03510 [Vibrio kanaloae]NOH99741.1 hypothetical protein [Vibrio kanaloae]TKE98023.1 hypothetical protein FCV44_08025 [Vibrio kanaloae]TKF05401.1 hypothetical protein FCV46_07470 [Vibrio kanaloae]TKF15047.1 hypothetical protein FCV47_14655 [Vibrio kanaloae]
MPDLYCKGCKKTTPHKSVMKRCESEPETVSGRMMQWTSKLFSGNLHYNMETQHFCRTCNCRSETGSTVPRVGLANV